MHVMEAAELLEAAYMNNLGSAVLIKPGNDGAQAFLMTDGTLLIPGTNELSDWTRYNLKIFSWKTAKVTNGYRFHSGFLGHANLILQWLEGKSVKRITGSLSVVKSRVLGSVSSGSVVLYEVRDYPAS